MEDFPRKRNLEDLWCSVFPFGTEWEIIDKVKEFNWNFKNLEETLEEGGELYGKTVYLFGNIEPQLADVNGETKLVFAPSVVAVDCPFPPSDKIGINLVRTGEEEIVPMQRMKMSWVPYVPLEDRFGRIRFGRIESLKTKIFTLHCTLRRSVLQHMKTERANKFDNCTPYYMPLNPPKDQDRTLISAMYSLDPPIIIDCDWEFDDYKVLANDIVNTEGLPKDDVEKIVEFLEKRIKQRKIQLEQDEKARKKALEDMDPKQREAFENIRFYKFYPVKTPDTPDVSNGKSGYINSYYGNAHYLM